MSDYLFKLLCNTSKGTVIVYAFDKLDRRSDSHTYIDIQVRLNGEDIFPKGSTWCGVPNGTPTDGNYARELVLSTVAMRPGDTDSEYFSTYTPAQLEFATSLGEELSCICSFRFCDENGNLKKGK